MLRPSRRFLSPSPSSTSGAGLEASSKSSSIRDRFRVAEKDLSWECDRALLPFKTTASLKAQRQVIGQNKAMRALRLGIQMESPGYNIFICGLAGTGRRSAVRQVLARCRRERSRQADLCYVPDFDTPERPLLLDLPPGMGSRFRRDVHALLGRVARLRERLGSRARRRRLESVLKTVLPVLRRRFAGPKTAAHLDRLRQAILDRDGKCSLDEMGVNLLWEASRGKSSLVAPTAVSYGTLFGVVDTRGPSGGQGASGAAFADIRAGAVVEASGGYLVLGAADLLEAKGCWGAMKRCLEQGILEFRDLDPSSGELRSSLRPEPIPLRLKVILIGDYTTYDYLFDQDPDFVNLFKIRVDFDSDAPLSRTLVGRDYPGFISRVVRDEKLRHFTAAAVARVVDYGVRRAGRKNKITTELSAIADLVREANFWAERSGRRLVLPADVERALRSILDRLNLVETKISEMIRDGTILIDTAGERIGQVNGLAVYDQGDYIFGKPSRITAETSVGQGGIINIERESGLSGKSHDKGIQILGGYLRSRFAQKRPLSLTASVCFEQSYSGVDGDSASSTEIYAILSSLSGLPIRQDLAVTGSMNQKGDIQPIGGVNEKIEGFFDCIAVGRATGREGVIIPRRNIPELMLRRDVVEAVRNGGFHIYAISTVEEGIEILTGVRAGRMRRDGSYAPGTVFARADRRLDEIARDLRQASTQPPQNDR